MDAVFVKERPHPPPGSIPALLDMFRNEVRFYREVAPEVGVRVPGCHLAEEGPDGFRLELEDLGHWTPGGDPVAVARVLSALHERWHGRSETRWPWLRRGDAAADVIGELYDRTWQQLRHRDDLTAPVRDLGESLVGRVADLERDEAASAPLTLVHGDAALRNVRTSPDGEIALLDWEDVRLAPAAVDIAWLLVSSVEPERWDAVVEAAGTSEREVAAVLPVTLAQGVLSLPDLDVGSADAAAAIARLGAGADRT